MQCFCESLTLVLMEMIIFLSLITSWCPNVWKRLCTPLTSAAFLDGYFSKYENLQVITYLVLPNWIMVMERLRGRVLEMRRRFDLLYHLRSQTTFRGCIQHRKVYRSSFGTIGLLHKHLALRREQWVPVKMLFTFSPGAYQCSSAEFGGRR